MSESPTHPDAPRAGGETPTLLPCPFCGHPPYVSRSANGTEMLFVGCAVCGIEFKSAWYRDAGNPTRDIVAAWNRRASLLERHRDGERERLPAPSGYEQFRADAAAAPPSSRETTDG